MLRLAGAIVVLGACAVAGAQTPGFWFVPVDSTQDTVNSRALSRDGSTLVGSVHYREGVPTYQGADGFRWTRPGGTQVVPDGGATIITDFHGVSADGQMVAGTWSDASVLNSTRPFRQAGNGPRELMPLPTGFTYGEARGISDDGNVVVGNWNREFLGGTMRQPFVWTPSGGTVLIGQLSSQNLALAISRNGTTVVGVGNQVGWAWSADLGLRVLQPPFGGVSWDASAVNSDGSIVAGTYTPGTDGGMIRWVNGVPTDMGTVPGLGPLHPVGMNDSGTLIAGVTNNVVPYLWSEGQGFVSAPDYFRQQGVSLPDGLTLYQLTAMTPDGLTFAGYGVLDGVSGAYVVTIPAPPVGAIGIVGMALVGGRRRRVG